VPDLDLDFVGGRLDVHTTMVELDGYMEESSPKDPSDHVFVSSKSGSVGRIRTFRRGWFDDAAEQIAVPGRTSQGIWSYLRGSPGASRPCPAEP
jgi:hypothetical protein